MLECFAWTGGTVFYGKGVRVVAAIDPSMNLLTAFTEPGAVFGYVLDGQNAVLRMAEIVRSMAESGLSAGEICTRLGMEDEELERLLDRSGMTVRATAGVSSFGRAWVPGRKG